MDQPRDLRVASDDGVNLVVFRENVWCHNEDCTGHGHLFSSRAYGMTQTYPEGNRSGSVRGADIELNAVNYEYYSFAIESTNSAFPAMDIEAALLHEVGHALGLQDTCSSDAGSCAPELQRSVMFAPAKMRELTSKDVQALCELYPRSITSSNHSRPPWLSISSVAIVVVLAGLLASSYRRKNSRLERR